MKSFRFLSFFIILFVCISPIGGPHLYSQTKKKVKPKQGMPYFLPGEELLKPIPKTNTATALTPQSAQKTLGTYGIVTSSDTHQYHILRTPSQTLSDPITLPVGTAGNFLLDVVITPNSKMAILSSFIDQRIHFLNLNQPWAPRYTGYADLPMLAEDITVIPNGNYAVVTDGGFSPTVVSVHIPTRTVADNILLPGGREAQAIEAAPDGSTILAVDFLGGFVYVLTINPNTGILRFVDEIDVSPFYPINVTISPNGGTAIVSTPSFIGPMAAIVLKINSPGNVILSDILIPPDTYFDGQSVAFAPNGRKAYYYGYFDDGAAIQEERIYELNISGPGEANFNGQYISLTDRVGGLGGYYGVDTIAVEPWGNYAYVGNKMPLSDHVTVVNLNTREVVKTLPAADFPTSIAIVPATDIEVSQTVDQPLPFVGETIRLTINVTNHGPAFNCNPEIQTQLPEQLTYVSHQGEVYDPETGRWEFKSLGKGETRNLTLEVLVEQDGTFTHTASLRKLNKHDADTDNNSSTVTIIADYKPDFSDRQNNYLIADKLSVMGGREVTFSIFFKNSGGYATGVKIQCPVNENFDSVQILNDGTLENNMISWAIGTVDKNTGGMVQFKAILKKGLPRGLKILNQATIDADRCDPVSTNTSVVTVVN